MSRRRRPDPELTKQGIKNITKKQPNGRRGHGVPQWPEDCAHQWRELPAGWDSGVRALLCCRLCGASRYA